MELKKIIGLAAGAYAVSSYINSLKDKMDKELADMRKKHEDYVNTILNEKEDLEHIVNPNDNVHQAPVIFTADLECGGQMLEQNALVLNCTNTSSNYVELADFQATVWVAGRKSDWCAPSNLNGVKIPPKSTISFRLFASYGSWFTNYVEVKWALNALHDGAKQGFMRAGTYIPLDKKPVLLNIQYLWESPVQDEKCYAFDVPCSFRWRYAGWVARPYAGYNAKDKRYEGLSKTWKNLDEIED